MPSSNEMPRAYNPSEVEEPLYRFWMEKGYFTPEVDRSKKPFVDIMPLPNVTGDLHLGHALTMAIQDILTRWHRMMGDAALWLPGKDHAGIATQVVVERQLASEGTSRWEMGREKFLERMWDWVGLYGSNIEEQLKRIGSSCDWSRLVFTLDPGPSRAVRTAFVNLYEKGLIYRGERIINWCIRCSTALSDLEVEYEEEDGYLYYVNYPMEEGEGSITVATTRPETMFGDTGVAVHQEDPRYQSLLGRNVILPLVDRPIPVVGDDAIDREFGTGVLKVTPGHDTVDFEIGQRHNLPIVMSVDDEGNLTEAAGQFQGQERFEARRNTVAELERQGYLVKTESLRHSIGHCQRCATVVEPFASKQWFIKIEPLAQPAMDAVKDGKVRIVPERFSRVYLNWMENIRDWCISRQLWWGHRIPVWYCEECGGLTVSVEDATSCRHCGSQKITQDPDVLDTWFSSGLWTHSTLGWPDESEALDFFYPSHVMVTGYDILFFWVARMIMMGIENMGEPPFETVFLHGLVRDAQGRKMSKTTGNVLDPLELTEAYGTDALRFALTTGAAPGNDLRLSTDKLESSRNFANKLWNASRFVIGSLEDSDAVRGWHELSDVSHREDRWILSRLNRVIGRTRHYLERFEIGEAQREVYDFLWNEFCDWYIEFAKIRMRDDAEPSPLPTLAHVLERTLRLLHPFMPFVTEEVWQRLTRQLSEEGVLAESIMIAPYPEEDATRVDDKAVAEVTQIITLVRSIRNIRAQLRINPREELQATVDLQGHDYLVGDEVEAVKGLARLRDLSGAPDTEASHDGGVVTVVAGEVVVALPLGEVTDLAEERRRLEEERDDASKHLKRVDSLLARPQFRAKAPEHVVEREKERSLGLRERLKRLEEVLAQLPP